MSSSPQPAHRDEENPLVTIGLVTLNEEKVIAGSLGALIDESRNINSEIVVVAGGTDRTIDIVSDSLLRARKSKLLRDSTPRGKPAALNWLVRESRGEILVLSDGDVTIRKGSIRGLVDAFSDDGVGCATGKVIGAGSAYNTVQRVCDAAAEAMDLSRYEQYLRTGSVSLASGYIIAVRKSLMPIIPEDTNSDDGYISAYVRSKGFRIAYVESAIVEIKFPRTLSDYIKQKSRTRYGHLQVRRQFREEDARSPFNDLKDFARSFVGGSGRKHRAYISVLALILTGFVWIVAMLRMRAPWLFRRHVWEAVKSTKVDV